MRNIIAILLTLILTGCATGTGDTVTPEDQWYQARNALTGVERALLNAYQGGFIDRDEFLATEPAVKAAQQTLTDAEQMLPDGGEGFDVLLSTLNSITTSLSKTLATEMEDP